MEYKYHTLLGDDQLIMIRWPATGFSEESISDALCIVLKEHDMNPDQIIMGNLAPTDVFVESREATFESLDGAFNHDPNTLPQFDLFDYRGGKFIKIVRPKRRTSTNSDPRTWRR